MQLEQLKTLFAAGWLLAMCAVAISVNLTTVQGWTTLTALTLLPPLLMLRMWNHPRETTSETIRKALR